MSPRETERQILSGPQNVTSDLTTEAQILPSPCFLSLPPPCPFFFPNPLLPAVEEGTQLLWLTLSSHFQCFLDLLIRVSLYVCTRRFREGKWLTQVTQLACNNGNSGRRTSLWGRRGRGSMWGLGAGLAWVRGKIIRGHLLRIGGRWMTVHTQTSYPPS